MNRKYFFMLLFCISYSIHAIAQTDYYYYQGKKTALTLNSDKVCISIPKESDKTNERIKLNVQVLGTIKDENFDILVITRSDFERLTSMELWDEVVNTVILTSGYYTENKEEVIATPYLNARLNKEQDLGVLTSYAENYRLKIIWNSPLMPLWYVLALTQDSEKSTLECANELYESGHFASSLPDLVSFHSNEMTEVWSTTIATPEKTTETFNLYGRKQTSKAVRGVFIRNGRKVLMK